MGGPIPLCLGGGRSLRAEHATGFAGKTRQTVGFTPGVFFPVKSDVKALCVIILVIPAGIGVVLRGLSC